ncbi:alanine racemase [Jannaschia pagri]|uniref:Alanine racemase n=1 Tax=Jannaschia pagri TaxID=2829797 RepID=A0ABQ4NN51_9RHOB|nr:MULTISPECIES: alanine racemase [unclassified Jannaschia]GIT91851.1 alanine racemase [Jannaschia sp. AI_61]GIT95685.1 alanine racemase [Jannaschia sp. AI_62]
MPTGTLHIDLEAVAANWRALDRLSASSCETAAVVKADGYGLGMTRVAPRLAKEGARAFFTASAAEGLELRRILGPEPRIYVLYGHMAGDTSVIERADLVPMICSIDQLTRHFETLPQKPFGIQLDTGMNRLGLKQAEWAAVADLALGAGPVLIMSHLASADEPGSQQNNAQLSAFRYMTDGLDIPRSLSATGGTTLGPGYHFDMVRPGIGLYGGLPFKDATPVVGLDLPVIACFDIEAGDHVGYGASWTAQTASRIATVAGGYADGLPRSLQPDLEVMAGPVACRAVGRVSMDMLTIDISHLDADPTHVTVLDPHRTVDTVAGAAGTIGYEILTNLGQRYTRQYRGDEPA